MLDGLILAYAYLIPFLVAAHFVGDVAASLVTRTPVRLGWLLAIGLFGQFFALIAFLPLAGVELLFANGWALCYAVDACPFAVLLPLVLGPSLVASSLTRAAGFRLFYEDRWLRVMAPSTLAAHGAVGAGALFFL